MHTSTTVATPVGMLTMVGSPAGLRAVLWPHERAARVLLPQCRPAPPDDPLLTDTARQLREYFAGDRTAFDLPLELVGTPFQVKVWQELLTIPYGATARYGELAAALGDARKARAVGAAVGRNPVSVIVPCHRVVGADGSLTGFAGGLDAKRLLLDLERRVAQEA